MLPAGRISLILIFVLGFAFRGLDAQQRDTSSSDSAFVMQKSPWGAVMRSVILPGWGQFYNESYWKIPLVLLIDAWFLYNYRENDKLFINNDRLFLQTQSENYRRYREFYRDQRDLFAIYLGLTYMLTLVDAYVDAQLFDFSVTEPTNFSSFSIKVKYGF